MWRFKLLPLLVSALALVGTPARERPLPTPFKLSDDHLGESLKEFRSRHKRASCHRRPSGEAEESKLKAEWLTWVDCGFEGTGFSGEVSIRENPSQSCRMFATFHDKKLVELGYTLADQSIANLLPALVRRLGEPSRTLFTEGDLQSVTWERLQETLTIESISIPPVAIDGQFLRIGRGTPAHAVRLSVTGVNSFQGASKW
jgi:hypothetical protein